MQSGKRIGTALAPLMTTIMAACATPQPTGLTETVTYGYKAAWVAYGSINDAIRVTYGMRLRHEKDGTAVCGAVGHDGGAGILAAPLLEEILSRTKISYGDETLIYGVKAFPLYDKVNIKGVLTTCLMTGHPWRDEYSDSKKHEITPPSRIQAKV